MTLLAGAHAQNVRTQTFTTTRQQNQQPLQLQVLQGGLQGNQGGVQTITLEDLQRLGLQNFGQGGQTIRTIDASQLQGLGLQNFQQGGQTVRTIDSSQLQGLNLQGLQGLNGGGNIRIIQIPAGGSNIQGLQGLNVASLSGSQGGGAIRTTSISTTSEEESEAGFAVPQPQPIPQPRPVAIPRRIVTIDRNEVNNVIPSNDEPEGEPKPEPYSFAYSADTEDGASSSREESQDANGVVTGFYTIQEADGRSRRVDYVADENGYRATVTTNEIGTANENPADVIMQSSAPSAADLSRQWTRDQAANPQPQRPVARAQVLSNANDGQNFATFRTGGAVRTVTTEIVQPQPVSRGNFEIIRPAAIQEERAAVVVNQPAQPRFVVVQLQPGQQAPSGAQPLNNFRSGNSAARQAAAASENRPFRFQGAFGSRLQAAATKS